jgi:hypothetical protein
MEAASEALKWIEVDRQSFKTARILNGDDVLDIQVGLGETNRRYRVRVQRIREWRDLKTLDPNSETHTESVREFALGCHWRSRCCVRDHSRAPLRRMAARVMAAILGTPH